MESNHVSEDRRKVLRQLFTLVHQLPQAAGQSDESIALMVASLEKGLMNASGGDPLRYNELSKVKSKQIEDRLAYSQRFVEMHGDISHNSKHVVIVQTNFLKFPQAGLPGSF